MASPAAIAVPIDVLAKSAGYGNLVILPEIVSDWMSQLLLGFVFREIGTYFARFGLADKRVNLVAMTLLLLLYLASSALTLARLILVGWDNDYLQAQLTNSATIQATSVTQLLPMLVCQLVFCYRLHGLAAPRFKWTAIAIAVLATLGNFFGVSIVFAATSLPQFPGTTTAGPSNVENYTEFALWISLAVDIFLSVGLSICFLRSRTGIASTEAVLKTFLAMTFANAFVTVLLGLGACISLHIKRSESNMSSLFGSLVSAAYGLCLAVNLNMRQRLKAQIGSSAGVRTPDWSGAPQTIRLSPMPPSSVGDEKGSLDAHVGRAAASTSDHVAYAV